MPVSKRKRKLEGRKRIENMKRILKLRALNSEKVEEPILVSEVNLGSELEEGMEKNLEVCPDSEDEIESGLVLSNNEKEMIKKETLNRVQKRKKTKKFDKGLLDKKNVRNKSDSGSYILMQASQLTKLIGDVGSCTLCGGKDFKIGRVKRKKDAAFHYTLECRSKVCDMKVSTEACSKIKLGGEEVSDIDARFSKAYVDSRVSYDALSSIFTSFGLPVPSASQTSHIASLLPKEREERNGKFRKL